MRKLILVKHSLPEIFPSVEASQWQLSPDGRRRCAPLASLLAVHEPGPIIASREPKAAETAGIIATLLGRSYEVAEGLHEHDRTGVAWLGAAEFEARVAAFFAHPDELVFGQETASAAWRRFNQAIEQLLQRYPVGNPVVVTHGTVISLFVAQAACIDGFALWKRLGLPSFVVLALPGFQLIRVDEQEEQDQGPST